MQMVKLSDGHLIWRVWCDRIRTGFGAKKLGKTGKVDEGGTSPVDSGPNVSLAFRCKMFVFLQTKFTKSS
jgi:hypothetical protein